MGPKKATPRILSQGRGRKSVPSTTSGSSSSALNSTAARPVNSLPPSTPAFRPTSQVVRPTAPQNVRPSFPGSGINLNPHQSTAAIRAELAQMKREAQQIKKATGRGRGRGRGKQMNSSRQSFQEELLLRQQRKQQQLQQQRKLESAQMGSFFLWLNENRDKLEKENPNLVGSYLVIKAGKVFRSLNPTERYEHEAKVKRTPPAYIKSLIEIGSEDFVEEFQDAKFHYDVQFPSVTQVKSEVLTQVLPPQNVTDSM